MNSKAGRPVGWRKPEGVRKARQLKAYDDEWVIVNSFASIVKHGDRPAAEKALQKLLQAQTKN